MPHAHDDARPDARPGLPAVPALLVAPLIGIVSDGVVLVASDGETVEWCNEAFAELVERPLAEIIGGRPDEVWEGIPFDELRSLGEEENLEDQVVRPNGAVRIVLLRRSIVQGRALVVFRDITRIERYRRERSDLRRVIDAVPFAILELTGSGLWSPRNPAATRLARRLGFSSPQELLPADLPTVIDAVLRQSPVPTGVAVARGGHVLHWTFVASRESETVLAYGVDFTALQEADTTRDRRDEYLACLVAILGDLMASPDAEADLPRQIERLRVVTGADRCHLYVNRTEGDELVSHLEFEAASEGIMRRIDNPVAVRIPLATSPLSRWLPRLRAGRSIECRTAAAPEPEKGFLDSLGVASTLVLPIGAGTECYGWIGFDACGPARSWSRGEQDLLRAAADAIATALARSGAQASLRENDERFRALVENSPYARLVARGGIVVFANPAAARLVGAAHPDLLIGRRLIDHIEPDTGDRAFLEQTVSAVGPPATGRQSFEVRVRRDNASLLPAQLHLGPVLLEGIPAIEVMIVDRSLEADLLRSRLEAARTEGIATLAGGVAHDFNNLLSVILCQTELLRSGLEPDSPADKAAAEVLGAAERGAGLVRHLLAFSRQQFTQPRILNLNTLVAEAERSLRRLMPQGIELLITPGDGLWDVNADPTQLEQVLVNLAVNARDAINGEGRIRIETANLSLPGPVTTRQGRLVPGDYVILVVRDTGPPMPPAILDSIFQPFAGLDARGRGMGLGLAAVHGIVAQAGGIVTVESRRGRGTAFWVYLPRATGDAIAQSAGLAGTPLGQLPGGSETILLAEDETALRSTCARVLREKGYHVLSAANGTEALDLLRAPGTPRIDLLVTDLVMPGLDGYRLARRLREETGVRRVIFMTGHAEARPGAGPADLAEEGLPLLRKPWTPRDLLWQVRAVLDSPPPPS